MRFDTGKIKHNNMGIKQPRGMGAMSPNKGKISGESLKENHLLFIYFFKNLRYKTFIVKSPGNLE